MSDIFEYDESKQMTLKELYKRHDQDFPLLIIIMEGYCGDTHQETFETFQVLRIHCSTNQRRVVAKPAENVSTFNYKFYSIPVDYSIKFKVVKGNTTCGNLQTMADILDENKLPVLVKLGCEGIRGIKVACRKYQAMTFGNLLITKEYVEHFYLCNCITSDLKMFTTSVLCALSENMNCCVITGFRNRPQSEFKEYFESLNKQLVENNVTFDKNQGFPEFAEFTIAERSLDTGVGGTMPEDEPLVTLSDVLPGYEEKPPPTPRRNLSTNISQAGDDGLYEQLDPDSQLPPPVDRSTKPPPQRHLSTETSQAGDDGLHEQLDPDSQLPPPVDRSTKPKLVPQMNVHDPKKEGNKKPDFPNTTIAHAVVRPLNFTGYANRPLPPKPEESQGQTILEQAITNEPMARTLPKASGHNEDQDITEHELLVRGMKINDVASALKRLRLERYKLLFKSALVDGVILSQLKEEDFQREFGLTRIEAIRLKTFVKTGHVPN